MTTPHDGSAVDAFLQQNAARARAANVLRPALPAPRSVGPDESLVDATITAQREQAQRAPNPLRSRGA